MHKLSSIAAAVALALTATAASACPEGRCTPDSTVGMSATSQAAVGGVVSTGVTGPGTAVIGLRSSAGAGNITGAYAGGIAGKNGAVVGTAAGSLGASYTKVKGHSAVTGNGEAYGINEAIAAQSGTAYADIDASDCFGGKNDQLSALSEASQGTVTHSLVELEGNDKGKSKMFAAAGAFNVSGGHAFQGPGNNLHRAHLGGGTLGGSGVLVAGKLRKSGEGYAVASAGEYGEVRGQVYDGPKGDRSDVRVDGFAEQGSSSLAALDETGYAAGGTIGGAGFHAKSKLVIGEHGLLTKVRVSDWKFSASGAITDLGDRKPKLRTDGDGYLTGVKRDGVTTGGYAAVGTSAYSHGEVGELPEPEPGAGTH